MLLQTYKKKLAAQCPCSPHLLPLIPKAFTFTLYTQAELQLLMKPNYTQNLQG